ncbi:MAG: protein kinase [Vicinamibacterales bacterium]
MGPAPAASEPASGWSWWTAGRWTLEQIQCGGGGQAWPEVVCIGHELGAALDAVHAAGIVHGDVKPQTVMIERGTGRVVLIDFGCGRSSAGPMRSRLSGTPLYLAPELLSGGGPSPASDIYSLGVLLFRLITGEFPITAGDVPALGAAHRAGRIRRLEEVRPICARPSVARLTAP